MGIERRTFLQKLGWALLTLGAGDAGLSSLGDKGLVIPGLSRHLKALADPEARKLALLVGINQYPRSSTLSGCLTDVELQRELLIHRFGFHRGDILTLTDKEATREDIETAFVKHLLNQANTNDVVLFHFSGYGSRVKVAQNSDQTQGNDSYRLVNSLVPVDGLFKTKGEPAANDLLVDTLMLLMRSLETEKVTAVLDTSYISTGKLLQGNLRVRSFLRPPAVRPSPEELAFQDRLLLGLNSVGKKLSVPGKQSLPLGMIVQATQEGEPALECHWNGFSAGLFTYALTQYLWEVVPAKTVYISLAQSSQTVAKVKGKLQPPEVMTTQQKDPLLTYYLQPLSGVGAEGVVKAVEDNGKVAQLYLGGLPAQVLRYYSPNSCFLILPSAKESQALLPSNSITPRKLQLREREGLKAKAKLVTHKNGEDEYKIEAGRLVQELVRVIPRNLGLTVAVESEMSRIERVDATSAFANISAVNSVAMAGENNADCLLGRVEKTTDEEEKASNGEKEELRGGYGLFFAGREPIPNTVGVATEAVKSAVRRLSDQFDTLLAAKLLRLTCNEGSSLLAMKATLEQIGTKKQVVSVQQTRRNQSKFAPVTVDENAAVKRVIPQLRSEGKIQYRLENQSNKPVYLFLFGFDADGSAIAVYPLTASNHGNNSLSSTEQENSPLEPGETLVIPHTNAAFDWVVSESPGLTEVYLISSIAPFTNSYAALEESGIVKGKTQKIVNLSQPFKVAQALLEDLHAASAVSSDIIGSATDVYAFDVNAWTTLSFVYQVIS